MLIKNFVADSMYTQTKNVFFSDLVIRYIPLKIKEKYHKHLFLFQF